jgi:hypothetical protein
MQLLIGEVEDTEEERAKRQKYSISLQIHIRIQQQVLRIKMSKVLARPACVCRIMDFI